MQISFDPTNPDECAMVADIVETVLNGRSTTKAVPAQKAAKVEVIEEETVVEEVVEEEVVSVSREDAVALATKLVADGRTPDVKGVLAKYGAAKVSLVPEDKLAAFVADLTAL